MYRRFFLEFYHVFPRSIFISVFCYCVSIHVCFAMRNVFLSCVITSCSRCKYTICYFLEPCSYSGVTLIYVIVAFSTCSRWWKTRFFVMSILNMSLCIGMPNYHKNVENRYLNIYTNMTINGNEKKFAL